METATPDLGFDIDLAIGAPSADCAPAGATSGVAGGNRDGGSGTPRGNTTPATPVGYEKHAFEQALDQGYFERVGLSPTPSAMAKDWVF